MSIGIVIVTYRCRDFALRCLASIEAHLPHLLPDVVVVDNASGDGTVEAVEQAYPIVQRIAKERNVGFAAAVNAGIRAIPHCEVIALLNPDAELLDGNIEKALEYFRDNPEVGVLGIGIENPDGSLQLSCRSFPSHKNALFNRHSLLTRWLPSNRWSREYLLTDWDHSSARAVDWVSGAAMLIHRQAIERVGLLDPGYFFSIEDVDYCRRVHDAGFEVRYFPQARVRHRIGGSSRHAAYRAMLAHHQGMWRYYKRHMRGNVLVDIATLGGIGARLGLHAAALAVRRALGRDRTRPRTGASAG